VHPDVASVFTRQVRKIGIKKLGVKKIKYRAKVMKGC